MKQTIKGWLLCLHLFQDAENFSFGIDRNDIGDWLPPSVNSIKEKGAILAYCRKYHAILFHSCNVVLTTKALNSATLLLFGEESNAVWQGKTALSLNNVYFSHLDLSNQAKPLHWWQQHPGGKMKLDVLYDTLRDQQDKRSAC